MVTVEDAEIAELKAREFVPESLIVDELTYLAWHQLEATEGHDDDGFSASDEFFFGPDPFLADSVTPVILSTDPMVLQILRNKLAAAELPRLWESNDLEVWAEADLDAVEIVPFDNNLDWIRLTPVIDPVHDKWFFRLSRPSHVPPD